MDLLTQRAVPTLVRVLLIRYRLTHVCLQLSCDSLQQSRASSRIDTRTSWPLILLTLASLSLYTGLAVTCHMEQHLRRPGSAQIWRALVQRQLLLCPQLPPRSSSTWTARTAMTWRSSAPGPWVRTLPHIIAHSPIKLLKNSHFLQQSPASKAAAVLAAAPALILHLDCAHG